MPASARSTADTKRKTCASPYVNIAVGSCKLAVGSYKLSVGSCKLSVGSCKLLVGSCKLAVSSCKLSVGSCKLAVSSCKLSVGSCKLSVDSCKLAVGSFMRTIPQGNSYRVSSPAHLIPPVALGVMHRTARWACDGLSEITYGTVLL